MFNSIRNKKRAIDPFSLYIKLHFVLIANTTYGTKRNNKISLYSVILIQL